MNNFIEKQSEIFENIKIKENESKAILVVLEIRNEETNLINANSFFSGSKINISETIINFLKQQKPNVIQEVFEAIKETI